MLNTDRVNDAKGYWASRDCFSCYSCCHTRGYTYPIDNQRYFDSYSPIHAHLGVFLGKKGQKCAFLLRRKKEVLILEILHEIFQIIFK